MLTTKIDYSQLMIQLVSLIARSSLLLLLFHSHLQYLYNHRRLNTRLSFLQFMCSQFLVGREHQLTTMTTSCLRSGKEAESVIEFSITTILHDAVGVVFCLMQEGRAIVETLCSSMPIASEVLNSMWLDGDDECIILSMLTVGINLAMFACLNIINCHY